MPRLSTGEGAAPGSVEDRTLVLGALSNMAPKQQEVLVLRYLHDLSVEETAEELGLTTGTVKSQSARGLATLRKRLGPHLAALATAAATVAAIIAIIVAVAGTTTAPKPVEPAVPPRPTQEHRPTTSPNSDIPTSSSADAATSEPASR